MASGSFKAITSAGSSLKCGRSRLTNGAGFLLREVDPRSPWARRYKDLLRMHVSDLGGESEVSAAEQSILRRAATLQVELEILESRFAMNDVTKGASAADINLYTTTASRLRRLFETVGLRRRARDVTPDLNEYISEFDTPDTEDAEVVDA